MHAAASQIETGTAEFLVHLKGKDIRLRAYLHPQMKALCVGFPLSSRAGDQPAAGLLNGHTLRAKPLHWVALNGGSVAVSPFALPGTLSVSPTPQFLLGFATRNEAIELQKFILSAPIEAVHKRTEELLNDSKVALIVPDNPEAPIKGATIWDVSRK